MNDKLDLSLENPIVLAEYVPLCDFREKMKLSGKTGYKSVLSFNPLLERANSRIAKNGGNNKKEIKQLINKVEEYLVRPLNGEDVTSKNEHLESLVPLLFPALFLEGGLGFIGIPFTKEFVYQTARMKELMSSEQWEVKMPSAANHAPKSMENSHIATMLLKKFYKPDLDITIKEKIVVRDKASKLERHYRIDIISDYIDVITDKPIPKLTDEQLHQLTNELDNQELWMEYFPPEDFTFKGFVIGQFTDITEMELVSILQNKMVKEHSDTDSETALQNFIELIRSFLKMPELSSGCLLISDLELLNFFSWSVLAEAKVLAKLPVETFAKGLYGELQEKQEAIIIGDLKSLPKPGVLEKMLLKKGARSLLLIPLNDVDGNLLGVFEIYSPKTFQFSKRTVFKLEDVISTFEVGTERYFQQMNNEISLFVQQQYTSIHPSVQWKFTEVSKKYLWNQDLESRKEGLDPIVFDEVYPLYAQADIVGSSGLRNESIVRDFIDNLQRVIAVMSSIREIIHFHLLDIYLAKSKEIVKRLEGGEFASSDESLVMNMLTSEIHPLIKELVDQFPQIPKKLVTDYFDALDPKLNIIYDHRKAYEDSVSQLNEKLARYMEKEDSRMQEILPHFFEKYSTDGIEYNIYLGQSLLPKGRFSHFYLKDFRIWQLMSMCEVTRIVHDFSPGLPVPLATAQLIFVYNSAMSIRFKMEEKQFDVDGTYNVRYEILKKRIDKAVVKGTKERLTQAGKIAIVWLQEKDRLEYLGYIDHLIHQGHLENEIEELELDKLQGAEGLKALRVTVKI